MLDHARGRAQPRRKRGRVADRAEVVGDQVAVGARELPAQPRVADLGERAPDAEAQQLERHRRVQRGDDLLGRDDHDEPARRRGDDLLAGLRRAAALDEPAGRVDLVGAVDREVELAERVEVFDGQPERPRRLFGRGRGGRAAQALQISLGQGRQQIRDCRTGSQPDTHPILDHRRRGLGGRALEALGRVLLA